MIYLCLEKEWKQNMRDLDLIFYVSQTQMEIWIVLSQKKHALMRAVDVIITHWRSKGVNKLLLKFLSLSKTFCFIFVQPLIKHSNVHRLYCCAFETMQMHEYFYVKLRSEKELSWKEVLSWLSWTVLVCWTRWKALYFWCIVSMLLIFIMADWQLLPQCTTHQS